MKACYLLSLLFIASPLGADEVIPVERPKVGEARPSWWLTCWMDHVVALKGKLTFEIGGEPDLKVVVSDKILEEMDAEERGLYDFTSSFVIGEIEATELVFASAGITDADLSFRPLFKKKPVKLKCLIRVNDFGGRMMAMGLQSGMETTFVFKYGTSYLPVPLEFSDTLSPQQMKSASLVFEHRHRYDYRRYQYQKKVEVEDAEGDGKEGAKQ